MLPISNLILNFSKSLVIKSLPASLVKQPSLQVAQKKFETTATSSNQTGESSETVNIPPKLDPKAEKAEYRKAINAGLHGNGIFPTIQTGKSLLVDNVEYEKLHIVHVKSSKNNTIICVTDFKGNVVNTQSAGTNGFKNAKKSTAIAAQVTAVSLAENMKRRGIKNVKLVLKGLGNGRLASIKSLQTYGLNIVSITDHTPVPYPHQRPLRPRMPKRL